MESPIRRIPRRIAMKKQSTNLRILKLFVSYWFLKPKNFWGALLLAPAYVLQFVVSPVFIAKSIGELTKHQPLQQSNLWFAATALIAGVSLTYYATHRFEAKLNAYGISAVHEATLQLLLNREHAFFADNFAGALVTRANRFARAYEVFTFVTFVDMLGLVTSVIAALLVMCFLSPAIGIAVTLLWLTSIVLVVYLAVRRIPVRRKAVAHESIQTGELADIITNAITVKTFAREANEQSRYHKVNITRQNLFIRSWRTAAANGFVINLLCSALQLTVFIGGIWAIQKGELSIALFLLFQVYILRIIDSVMKTSVTMRHYEGAFGDASEMIDLFDQEPTILDADQPEQSRISSGEISLQNLTFSYTSDSNELLKNFNLKIAPGEKVGLVGPSGGGKTTITKLLLRFADVQDGAILIDGQDIRSIKQDDLHQAISFVPQEPLLFHRSIKENIGYGDPNASDAEIIAAAKKAHADEFITSLPHGYDTLVGERGIKLSGGQRQRVALARAMLKKAPILVLDEATSALDSESEHYIQESLWKLMEGKTAIVIAHRLSTIQKMNRIVVLDDGKIIEEGSHKELLEKNGMYAKLWAHQSGGFLED
jgi:ATP-binding cassette subfamily B protein